MMDKTAAPPEGEVKANAEKAETDRLAYEILDIDKKKVKKATDQVEKLLSKHEGPLKIVIAGGAGSGKTSLSGELSERFGLKHFDVDEYIEGGHTKDKASYQERLHKAWYGVWEDLPSKGGWIIEHVEACNPELIEIFKPDVAVLVDPGDERIRKAAEARNLVKGKDDPGRIERAFETTKKAKKQFNSLKGETSSSPPYVVKKLES